MSVDNSSEEVIKDLKVVHSTRELSPVMRWTTSRRIAQPSDWPLTRKLVAYWRKLQSKMNL
jgi:hypothetical protein